MENSGNKLVEQTVTLVSLEHTREIFERAPEAGQAFADRYEILEKLGEGGVGTVFKVRHLHLDKILALKLLQKHHLKDPDSVSRFCLEAKLISKLNHPGIVNVHDFGVHDSCPYMTMDYIEGQPISKLIGTETTTGMWIAIFTQVLDALAHAHQRGIVHRDLKPGNILFRIDVDTGLPIATVVDFGLAKAIDSAGQPPDSAALTRTGDLFGTPLYMSPEQCTGQQIDSRSDIYSLGCVMYHCFSSAPPFSAESNFELVYRQINCAPQPFSNAHRQKGLDSELEAIIFKAMAKEKTARHQYAQELSCELLGAKANRTLLGWLRAKCRQFSGRFHASEKSATIRNIGIKLAILNAVVISLSLCYLPTQMEHSKKEMLRHCDVIITLNQLARSNVFRAMQDGTLKTRYTLQEKLEKLTDSDPVLEQSAKNYIAQAKRSLLDTKTRLLGIRETMESNPAALLSGGLAAMTDGTSEWLDTIATNITLSRLADGEYNKNKTQLEFEFNLFRVLIYYGAVSLPILLWLIVGNIAHKRRASKFSR